MDWLNAQARRVPTWVVYGLGLVPLGFLIWGAFFGGLGPDPVKAIERGLGERGLQFLLASLAVMLFGYWLVPHSQQKLITLTLSLGMSVISAFTMIWVLVTGERKPRTKRKPVKKTDATPTGTTAE